MPTHLIRHNLKMNQVAPPQVIICIKGINVINK